MTMRALPVTLDPKTRGVLRTVLTNDFHDRNEMSSILMRYRDENGQDWADIVDFLTMYPEARRQVVRFIGEIDADSA